MKEMRTDSTIATPVKYVEPESALWRLETDTQLHMRQTRQAPYRAICLEDDYQVSDRSEASEIAARRYFLLVILLLVTCVFTFLAVTGRVQL